MNFRTESPRFRVSKLVLGLLALHLAELRRVTAVPRRWVGTLTAALGLLVTLVFRWLVTHGRKSPRLLFWTLSLLRQ